MIYDLSEEQEVRIGEYQRKWSQRFFSLEFDEEKVKDFVSFLYCDVLKMERPLVFFLDNPLQSQVLINIWPSLFDSRLSFQLGPQLDSRLDSRLSSQLDFRLDSRLSSQLDFQLFYKLRSQLSFQLFYKLRSQLSFQLSSQLDFQLDSQLGLKYFIPDWWGDTSWYGYLAFYDYLYDIVFPDTKIPIFEKYRKLADCNITNIITFEKIAFVSKPPTFIKFNDDNNLHCTTHPALSYKGWELCFVDGTFFEKELFNKAFVNRTITGEEILAIENAEQKAVIIKEYGFEKVFGALKNKKIIDRQERAFNKKLDKPVEYVLFETDIGMDYVPRILKVEWWGAGRKRQTVLGVPNTISDAIEAVAWTCHKTKEDWENKLVKEA